MGETQSFSVLFGVIIPAVIFIFSFVVTYMLYLHFAKKTAKKS